LWGGLVRPQGGTEDRHADDTSSLARQTSPLSLGEAAGERALDLLEWRGRVQTRSGRANEHRPFHVKHSDLEISR